MKRYTDLTTEEQGKANEKALRSILGAILEGGLRFNDKENNDGLQAAIDAACAKAEAMRTPWFAGEYILDTDYRESDGSIHSVRAELKGMAQRNAEDAFYPELGEQTIRLA